MTPQNAHLLLKFTQFTVETNLDGITSEAADLTPDKGGNSIHWVLGHIVATRRSLLKLLGAEAHWSDRQALVYSRKHLQHPDAPRMSWEDLLSGLADSQARLTTAIDGFTRWLDSAPGEILGAGESFGDQVAFFFAHEAYHAGQLGILRRTLGLHGRIGG